MLHISRCVKTRQTQQHFAHSSYSILSRVIELNAFVTCIAVIYDQSYDLYGGHRLTVDMMQMIHSIANIQRFITEFYLNRHGQLDS